MAIEVNRENAGTLAKLGSIVVHVEEALSDDGHPLDVVALKGLIEDADVQEVLAALEALALLSVRRTG